MILCLENFNLGMAWFAKLWGSDYVNSEYPAIYQAKNDGLTPEWWRKTTRRLWDWRAIRSPHSLNSIAAIFAKGLEVLPLLSRAFQRLEKRQVSEPNIEQFRWEEVAELFWAAHSIKHGAFRCDSPVFGSKLCHFIYPKVFPVLDNLGTGIFEYEFYWRGMKDEWARFPHKDEARDKLEREISAQEKVCRDYPFETKIIELCHIGYAQASAKLMPAPAARLAGKQAVAATVG